MSVQADQSPLTLLELPSTWVAHLVQHVASGAGGLASAAALSQTCRSLHALSESSAVTYCNLNVDRPLLSLDHPFWPWLAKRQGRIAGLTAAVRLSRADPEQLQLMFSIPDLHLTLRYDTEVTALDDPFMTKVLRPHGHLIDHLSWRVFISGNGLTLQDFCKAAAACTRLVLTAWHFPAQPLNMGDLQHVAGSLVRLCLIYTTNVEAVSRLSLLSQLTSLKLANVDFGAEEPWIHLGALTNLKQLSLWVAASGDPCPLSALTGLSFLDLQSYGPVHNGLLTPCTFSSLQPLSTLQQLKELKLHNKAYSGISLHGLAELRKLETLTLGAPMLKSLEGLSTGLTSLTLKAAPQLVSLAGIEGLTALQQLKFYECGLTSLQPVGQLVGGLRKLDVTYCHSVQEEVLELPHVQPTADVRIVSSTVKEVVLARGVRRRVGVGF